jgi:hypothetical protein
MGGELMELHRKAGSAQADCPWWGEPLIRCEETPDDQVCINGHRWWDDDDA